MPQFLNLPIDNLRLTDFLHELKAGVVFTPNVDHLMKLQQDRAFYEAYLQADYRLCDSRILQGLSGWMTGEKIVEQLAGSDVFPAFCRHHRANSAEIRIFLLGGSTAEAANIAQHRLNEQAHAPQVVGVYSPPRGFETDAAENERICEKIRASGATVLAVGVGAPKQELWIMAQRDQLPEVKIFFAIGATIDFLAGHQQRAPRWMSRLGLEWAYRLLQDPQRLFRRYFIEGLPFFSLAWQQKKGHYRNPWAENQPG
jgi:exopolysaccharide biosynthesis WecB/TagA/CpsF family protein